MNNQNTQIPEYRQNTLKLSRVSTSTSHPREGNGTRVPGHRALIKQFGQPSQFQGKYDEAKLLLIQRALAIHEKVLGSEQTLRHGRGRTIRTAAL